LMGGRSAIDRNGQMVLHAHPALYTIDGVEGVKNPIGLHADRLGVDIHVVAADPAPLRNIDYVIRSAHLGVKAIVASPVAAALACLTEDERELAEDAIPRGAGRERGAQRADACALLTCELLLGGRGPGRGRRQRLVLASSRAAAA